MKRVGKEKEKVTDRQKDTYRQTNSNKQSEQMQINIYMYIYERVGEAKPNVS